MAANSRFGLQSEAKTRFGVFFSPTGLPVVESAAISSIFSLSEISSREFSGGH
jgi:hypothetical protein